MNRKKFGGFIAVLLLMAIFTASCGDTSNTDKPSGQTSVSGDTSAEVTETTSALSTIKKQDFGGHTFKIISTNQDNRQIDVIAEEQNGATLNDLVYNRNTTVEESFNVVIEATDKPFEAINSIVQKAAQAGDNPYDLYMTNSTAAPLATKGYLLAWNDVPSIDISKPWWDQSAINDMSIAGKSYLMTGDISPTCLLTSECILFNKNLFDNKGIAYPYNDAFDGTWTIDKMIAIATGLTEDINGDGAIKVDDDLYSFSLWTDAGSALFYGAGGYMSEKDEGDLPKIKYDVEKFSNIYQKIYSLVIGAQAQYSSNSNSKESEAVRHERTFKIFNQGRAYFCDITFQKIEMFLRDMENDYGVLPLPKYDENQERYLTNVSGAGTMIVIPKSATDLDMIGTLIDGMAAASYDMISPSLYDIIAGTKNVRDAESADMVQMIVRNRVYDPIKMYGIEGNNFADDLLDKKSEDVASYFASREEKAKTSLDKLIESFVASN